MKLPKYLLTIIIAFPPIFHAIQAQENPLTAEQALQQEKIETQFDYVIRKSGKYQEYKVVKRVWLDKLKSNTLDSLKTLESKLKTANQQIAEQQSSIAKLEESLAKTNDNLVSITKEKDSMTFLGMPFSKSSYKTMMWTIIAALLAFLGFFIFKFKNSNSITVQAKKSLAETEAEFEEHRRRALEREQKVMRKLQDEINKQRKSGAK
ncbi:hypothetical protein AB832_02070, partial [Flavobacteriaceae bacterium (ex Bugula neritina AB1)]